MPTFSNIDGEESATVTFTVGAISLTRNSSAELQEILCIGDPDVASSLGIARVVNTAPASTMAGLGVRIISGPSSVADFSVRAVLPSTATDNPVSLPSSQTINVRSSAANALVTAYQSTAADLNVTVAGYSTTVNVSSVAGAVNVRSSAANALVTVYQSTAADLNVTVAGYSTTVNVSSLAGPVIVRSSAASLLASVYQSTAADLNVTVAGYSTTVNVSSVAGAVTARTFTSSGGSVEGSTTTPSTGSVLGLNVRQVMPSGRQSTSILVTSTHSTSHYTLASSVAGLKHKVRAYFVGSTHTNPSTLIFLSSTEAAGAGAERWHVNFGSGSSGITGANMALSGPDFIFETLAADALAVRIEGGSSVTATVVARVSVSWFTEA